MKDSKFGLTFWLNLHSPHVNTHVFPSTDLYLPPFSRQMKSTWCWSAPAIPVSEEAAETIWRALNAVSTCRNTFHFFDYLVIFRHYFTGDGKVSCILATISDWLPNIKIRQLATSSGNLVASAQFLVALATSESQFWALEWRVLSQVHVKIPSNRSPISMRYSVLTTCIEQSMLRLPITVQCKFLSRTNLKSKSFHKMDVFFI